MPCNCTNRGEASAPRNEPKMLVWEATGSLTIRTSIRRMPTWRRPPSAKSSVQEPSVGNIIESVAIGVVCLQRQVRGVARDRSRYPDDEVSVTVENRGSMAEVGRLPKRALTSDEKSTLAAKSAWTNSLGAGTNAAAADTKIEEY